MVTPVVVREEVAALSAVRWSGILRAPDVAVFALAMLLAAPALAQFNRTSGGIYPPVCAT